MLRRKPKFYSAVIKYVVLIYIFLVSWNGVFAINAWVKLPFLFVFAALIMVSIDALAKGKISVAPYKNDDYLILLFLAVFIFSALINSNSFSLNYILAYTFVLVILYLFLKGILFSYVTSPQIYAANVWGVTFVGVFLSINFILNYAGIIDLQAMIPRTRETTATYLYFNRGYGFSTEPGVVAFYMNVLGPLALWYLWREMKLVRFLKLVFTCLVAFGWLVTFSASGWAFLVLGLVVSKCIMSVPPVNRTFRIHRALKGAFLSIVLLAAVGLFASQSDVLDFAYPIYEKITLSDSLSSSSTRTDRWTTGVGMIHERPFLGQGPGYFSSENVMSVLSWYLMLLLESGFLSLFIMIVFLSLVLIRIVKFRHPSRSAVLIGFLAGCGHLLVISTFYHPFLWLLIAIFYAQQAHYNKCSTQNNGQLSNAYFCIGRYSRV